jgi:hypothetical protein
MNVKLKKSRLKLLNFILIFIFLSIILLMINTSIHLFIHTYNQYIYISTLNLFINSYSNIYNTNIIN